MYIFKLVERLCNRLYTCQPTIYRKIVSLSHFYTSKVLSVLYQLVFYLYSELENRTVYCGC